MPELRIKTDLPPDTVLRLAEDAAEDQKYEIENAREDEFHARKGSLTASIFFGAFILYADFYVTVDETKKGGTLLKVTWSTPWWTGLIGASRTKSAAKMYADLIEDLIEDDEGAVIDRIDP